MTVSCFRKQTIGWRRLSASFDKGCYHCVVLDWERNEGHGGGAISVPKHHLSLENRGTAYNATEAAMHVKLIGIG